MPLTNKTKYIFVSGGVISGIGKGIATASIAFLLKQAGYKVAPLKFENYLKEHPQALEEYRKLKELGDGLSTREYYRRKIEFINDILEKV